MNTEAVFWRLAQNGRVQMAELASQRPDFAPRAAIYIRNTVALAKKLQLETFPKELINWNEYKYGDPPEKIIPALYAIESYMGILYAENIFELDNSAQSQFIALNETWKSRAGSYVSRIRDIVGSAQVSDPIRQGIMNKLNALQSEIDRNQTRIESFGDMLVSLTGAIGRGAKNLEPAVKLAERIAGSIFNLRENRDQTPPLQLPAPESMGLPDPDDSTPET